VGKRTRGARGTHRRAAAFERRTTQHHEFIGENQPKRAEKLPEGVRKAIDLGEAALGLLLVPVRLGVQLVRDVLAVPAAMLRILTRREA